MSIDDFDFVKYDPERMEHIERHLEGRDVLGSYFSRKFFPDAKSVIDFAFPHVQGYNGERMVVEVNAVFVVGYDGIVCLDELPEDAEVSQGSRDGRIINIVRGIEKESTNQIVIVAGPVGKGKHGFESIYPGNLAPPLPLTEAELRQMGYGGEELIQAINDNREYAAFWERHGFIEEAGR